MDTLENFTWTKAPGFSPTKYKNSANKNIDLLKLPVRHHRATGMVEKTIGSPKIYVI